MTGGPRSESVDVTENGGAVQEHEMEEFASFEEPVTGGQQSLRRAERIRARISADQQSNSSRGGCDDC